MSTTSESEQLRARAVELEQLAARRARELTALHEIALEIGQLTDLDMLLKTIIEKAAGLLNARMGGLYLVHPETQTLKLVVAHNLPGITAGVILEPGEGLSGRIAQTGQVMVVPDYQAWPGRATVYEGAPFRRVVGVPLKIGEKVIGVINITDDRQIGSFDEDEVRLVTLFAEQAALAIEQARLLAEVQGDLAERQRVAQMQASLYRITEAVHTTQNLDELYRSIHAIIAGLMPARNFGIALYDAPTESFVFPYRVDEHYPDELTPPPRRLGRTLVDYVWQTGVPLLAGREQIAQLAAEQQLQTIGARALDWLGVPLMQQDNKSIGVMVVQTYAEGERLTEEHQRLLQFVSTQVAMAIQRKRAEQVQASIYRISEAAQTAASLDELYAAIYQIVVELMPVRNLYIALYDAARDEVSFPYYVDELAPDVREMPTRQGGTGITEYIVRLAQPWLGTQQMLMDLKQSGQIQTIGTVPVDFLGVPLRVADRVIGLIAVQSYSEHMRLTEEHRDILGFVSIQVAMAIQRKQTEQVRTAIYRIADAAHQARGLADLYQAIHEIVSELMPAGNFYLALYDAAEDTVSFPYFVDELQPEMVGSSRQHGQGLTEYVLRLGEPWLGSRASIQDLLDRHLVENIGPLAASWLGVPLVVDAVCIGLIAVQSYSERVRLNEEHKIILQYVSAQVAMTIQRKRAEEALRESEEKYRILFSNELVAICLFDAESLQLLDVNSAYVRMYGYSRAELLAGMTVRDVSAEPEQSMAAVKQARAGGTMFIPLRYHRKKDGSIFPVELVSGPFLWKGRTVFFAWIQDITERRQAETALRESERRYHDLFEAAQRQAQELTLLDRVRTVVTRELNLTELFRTVVNAIAETFGYTLVSLYVVDGPVLKLQYQVGYELFLTEVPLSSGVMGRVARTGQPELIEDAFSEPAFLATMDDIVSEIGVPLVDGGRTVGVLNIESTRGYRLTAADLRLIVAISEHVNSALTRARLYTEARQNAARLKAVVESLPFDLWAIGTDGRYVVQNSVSTQRWGERMGKRVDELDIPEALRAHWAANDRRAFAGEVVQGEVTYVVDGEQRYFHEIIAPIWNEGEIQGIIGANIDITDRQKAETALRISEARLRAITTNIPVILFGLDREGIITFIEGQGLEAVNAPIETSVGRSVFDIAHDLPRVLAAANLALSGELLNVILSVQQRAYEVWLSPLTSSAGEFNGVIGVAVDMTDRERTAQALRDSEERYRILFDSNPYPMWAYDLETQRILAVNDAAISHYGYSRTEFLNMTIADLRPPKDVAFPDENSPHLARDIDTAGARQQRKKDGTLIEVEITSHTLVLDGRPAKVVLATDVTERRRTEEALHRAQKMESLGLLAGGIAHDFNNLLVAILGQASLAVNLLSVDSPARVPIAKAVGAAHRAADLTRQLLAYSGRGQFERRPIDLNRLIQENLHLFEVAVPKHVTLRSDLAVPLSMVVGDAGQLQQVIMNLIINAAEAIGDKSGEVFVRTRAQPLTRKAAAAWQIGDVKLPAGDYVQLLVEDNGQGMDAATLSRIFDPFFSTKFTGRGLGLAAVLGIVRGHGGGLKVSSQPQVGTVFDIILPGGTVEVLEPAKLPPLWEVNMTQQLVLVIDDEEPVRDAVTDILDLEGVTVLTAPDGHAGIELYRQRHTEIGLILLDLSMPGLNGEETFRELRQIDPQVRVLLSSGYSQDEVAARFAGQGEVGFIQKPYDAEQLVKEVKRYLIQPPTK